jgi:hypothetical protein
LSAVWAKIPATGAENCGSPKSACLFFEPSGDANLVRARNTVTCQKENYEVYTVRYGHHTSQRIRDVPRADCRCRFGVAPGRATLSPKRRAEGISGHLLRTARSLPAEQSKSAWPMEHCASVVSGLVFDDLNPRPKAGPWRLGHSYACRALSLPVADR